MKQTVSIVVRIILVLLLGGVFCYAINISYMHLLKPRDDLNSRTLYQFTNTYKEDVGLMGSIYDLKGRLLIANVALDTQGDPIMENGEYKQFSELEPRLQKIYGYRRMLLAQDDIFCWSNVLPGMVEGLDKKLSDILGDIPLNPQDSTDVRLTIDGNLQSDAYKILDGQIRCGSKYDNRFKADVVVMDVDTGNVLVSAAKPSFDYTAFRQGSIPYTSYFDYSLFYNNVDNAHDCVQDYYILWERAWQNEKEDVTSPDQPAAKKAIADWESDLSAKALLYDEEDAQRLLDYWNKAYGAQHSLNACMEVDFNQIFAEKQAFYEDERNEGLSFRFIYEPEALGNGEAYIPFVKLLCQENKVKYMKLCYGNNNFIYEDCVAYDFDPNFSLQNTTFLTTAPGSCFKILMTALLIDKAPENLIYDGDVHVRNVNSSSTTKKYIPPYEGSPLNEHMTLRQALEKSSNHFFAMCAIELFPILNTTESEYLCNDASLDRIHDNVETLKKSAAIMQDYYEDTFCVNTDIDAFVRIPQGQILSSLNVMEIKSQPDEDDYIYDDSLWYQLDEDDNVLHAYTDSADSLMKKIGDSCYGQGYDQISPYFMAMSMGKCLTGKMVVPNFLADESEPVVIGKDFERGQQTVDMLKDHLNSVYKDHKSYVPADLSFPEEAFTYYSKTGTSSVDKGTGTRSTYGLFAEKAQYQTDGDTKYQTIWYVGAVSDNNHTYAIVIRSFFDIDSYSLKGEFLKIVESLYQNGYLQY